MIKTLSDKSSSSIEQIEADAIKHSYKILDWVNCNCDRCNRTLVQLMSPTNELFYACACGRRAKHIDRGEGGPLVRS